MEIKYKGHTIKITFHHDEDMGPPWEEHDGHGAVTEWVHRDKYPGERLLCSDRSSKRFYDVAETMKIAKKDGWGLCDEDKAKLAAKLGRPPTKKEVTAEAVERDFEYLRAWCADEWCWLGYTTEIEEPNGQTHLGDSCFGFDDEKYMLSEAQEQARATVNWLILTAEQTEIAAAIP